MTNEEVVRTILNQEAFISVNKGILRLLKGDAVVAIIFGELFGLYNYYSQSGMLGDAGWFFQTVDDIEETTGIAYGPQTRAIKKLQSIGFIDTKLMNTPPRRYFKVNLDNIKLALEKEVLVRVPQKEVKSKNTFYKEINEAITVGIEATRECVDNIDIGLGDFMFIWSRMYLWYSKNNWIWNCKEFSTINNYWRSVYKNRKVFNYKTLINFFSTNFGTTKNKGVSLRDLISFDRVQPEVHSSKIVTIDELLETYKF